MNSSGSSESPRTPPKSEEEMAMSGSTGDKPGERSDSSMPEISEPVDSSVSLVELWQELKERKVMRVAFTYAAASWLIIQIASATFPIFDIPVWAARWVTVLLVIGFPVALFLAWIFELTPEGIKVTVNRGASYQGSVSKGHAFKRMFLALGFAAALPTVIFGTLAAYFYFTRAAPMASGIKALGKSVAVLPFHNLSSVPDTDYFAAGIHDGLITDLAKIGALKVISRTSTLRYADPGKKLISEIARELGVGIIVEGSVQRVDDVIHVNAQLIDARTDEHLWSERFERNVSNTLVLQSEIARTIASEVNASLTLEEEDRLNQARTVDPEVYEAYLKGRYYLAHPDPEIPDLGLDYMRKAIELDPAEPLAYAGLAEAYVILAHDFDPPPDAFPKARAAVDKALALDPLNPQAYAVDADLKLYYEYDYAGAESAFQRAIELNPNLALNRYHYSWFLVAFNQFEEALEQHELASELDPFSPDFTIDIGALHYWANDPEKAISYLENVAPEFADNPFTLMWQGWALAEMGLYEEAVAKHEQLVELVPSLKIVLATTYAATGRVEEAMTIIEETESGPIGSGAALMLGAAYTALGQYETAFEWLNRKPQHAWMPWVRSWPACKALRDHPQFADLMHQVKLPMINYEILQPIEKQDDQGRWIPIDSGKAMHTPLRDNPDVLALLEDPTPKERLPVVTAKHERPHSTAFRLR